MNRLISRLSSPIVQTTAKFTGARSINTAVNSIYPDGAAYEYRESNKMMIRGFDTRRDVYVPILGLEGAPFHPTIVEYLGTLGLQEPTNAQAQAWPMILSGKDSVCISKRGTGKTLAYMAPLFSNLISEKMAPSSSPAAPKVLILTCKRAEALAVAETAKSFADLCGLKTAVVTGGYVTEEDASYLKQKGADVLVATAGRCAKLVRDHALDLSQVKKVVLDEGHVLLNPFQATDTKTVLKSLTKDGLQTVVVGGRWHQVNRDYEKIMLKRDMIFMQVLRPKRNLSGEPTARAMKTAQPSRRRRMLKRWAEREDKIRQAEVIQLTPSV